MTYSTPGLTKTKGVAVTHSTPSLTKTKGVAEIIKSLTKTMQEGGRFVPVFCQKILAFIITRAVDP